MAGPVVAAAAFAGAVVAGVVSDWFAPQHRLVPRVGLLVAAGAVAPLGAVSVPRLLAFAGVAAFGCAIQAVDAALMTDV